MPRSIHDRNSYTIVYRVGSFHSHRNGLSIPITNTRGRWIAVNRYLPLLTGLGFLIMSVCDKEILWWHVHRNFIEQLALVQRYSQQARATKKKVAIAAPYGNLRGKAFSKENGIFGKRCISCFVLHCKSGGKISLHSFIASPRTVADKKQWKQDIDTVACKPGRFCRYQFDATSQ